MAKQIKKNKEVKDVSKANLTPEEIKNTEASKIDEGAGDGGDDSGKSKKLKKDKKPKKKEVEETLEVVSKENSKAPEKTKVCIPLKDHSCRIGGKSITIVKDKEVKLSEGVAMILQRSRVIIVK